jgi:pantoate--beta-alanine ligase
MQIIRSIDEMQKISLGLKQEGKKIGFVPTMGFLHKGHLSLVDSLRNRVDVVILSIFVNPTQFGVGEDLDQYPKNHERDIELCKDRGTDFVFIPKSEEIYGDRFSTFTIEEELTKCLCGSTRPTHFQGVTTICAKLFNICQPNMVALGQKDFQQVTVLKRMIKDLNFPIKVVVCDTMREKDGLAMSSRNSYLSPIQRRDALLLYKSIQRAVNLVDEGIVDSDQIKEEVLTILKSGKLIQVDYIEIVDKENLDPLNKINPNQSIIVLAVWIEKVRLIDNQII